MTRSTFVSVQIRFCCQMSSDQVRFQKAKVIGHLSSLRLWIGTYISVNISECLPGLGCMLEALLKSNMTKPLLPRSLVDETLKQTNICKFVLDTKAKKRKHLDDTGESGKIPKEIAIANLIRNIFHE